MGEFTSLLNAYGGSTSNYVIDPFLSSLATGFMQDLDMGLAEFIAPFVAVPASIGHYIKFDDSNAFRIYDTARGLGGEAAQINWNKTLPLFNCAPQALGTFVDDAEKEMAGAASGQIVEAKLKSVVVNAGLSHENKVFSTASTLVTATANVGNWSNDAVDPISEIDTIIRNLAIQTGRMPNRAVIGLDAFTILRNNAKVKVRQKVTVLQQIDVTDIPGLTIAKQCEWRIGTMVKDTSDIGGTRSTSFILGSDVYIFYCSPSPTQYDPSWMKTFVVGGNTIRNVISWRNNDKFSDMYAVAWNEDIQQTSSIACTRITVT